MFEVPHSSYSARMEGEPLQKIEAVSCLNPRYLRERSGDFHDSKLAAKLTSLKDSSLVLYPDAFHEIIDECGDITAELIEKQEFAHSRRESRTEVRFGQLLFSSPSHGEAAELVSVKYTTPRLAAKESAASRAINRNSYLSPFSPAAFLTLGFLKRGDQVGYITRYKHNVITLDNVLWNDEEPLTEERVVKALGKAARWMADLHSQGITHGDAQSKNIAITASSQPHYPDLEDAHLHSTQAELKQYSLDDIETFLRFQPQQINPLLVDRYFSEIYLSRRIRNQAGIQKEELDAIARQGVERITRFNLARHIMK